MAWMFEDNTGLEDEGEEGKKEVMAPGLGKEGDI